MIHRAYFLTAICCVIWGCSDTEDDPTQRLRELGGFCDKWAELACNAQVVEKCAATDVEACRDSQSTFCRDLIPAGKYSNDRAEDCLAAVQMAYEDAELTAQERDTVRSLSGACNRVVSGSGGDGDPCEDNADCSTEAGLSCVRHPGESVGSCEEAEVVGGGFKCSSAKQVCDEGFYCDGQNCIEKNREGEACSQDVPCAEEFKCEAEVPGGAVAADGGALADAGFEAGAAELVCVARLPVGAREPCEKDDDCLSGVCAVGLQRSVCASAIVLSATELICADLS